MSKRKTTAEAAKITTVKKGEIFETKQKDLVEVVNGRLKDEGDLGTSFEGKSITTHETTGKVVRAKTTDRYYLDDLVRKLTKAEFDEWADAGRREAEATVAATEPAATTKGKKTPATKPTKPKAEPKAKKAKSAGKMSALDAAAKVLGETGEPMTTKAMIESMSTKGYWTSPGGQTPAATLYSAILREINVKGKESRFKKTDRGHFATK